jgi:DNA-binding IclR family transcriptional regulator
VLALSRQLQMDKSAVSRMLTTLRAYDYVRVVDDGRYDLGLKLFELGTSLQKRLPFRKAIIPLVDALAEETGETASVAHYRHGLIAWLYDCVSQQEIRLGPRTGIRSEPWFDVAGKAIFAQLQETDVLRLLVVAKKARAGRIGTASETAAQAGSSSRGEQLPSRKTLQGELARIRRQGYAAMRDNEKCLVAAALPNDSQPAAAALVVGGPSTRIDSRLMKQLGELVAQRAADASSALGWASG